MPVVVRSLNRSKFNIRHDAAGKAARTVDDIVFDSAEEAKRYCELKLLQRGKEIANLTTQYPLELFVTSPDGAFVVVGKYIADFRYTDLRTGKIVYEDVKSAITAELPLYRLKKKMVEATYGITIVEV